MIVGKRNMILRMPVLGQDNIVEDLPQLVNDRNNLIGISDGQIAARRKSILYIYYDQCRLRLHNTYPCFAYCQRPSIYQMDGFVAAESLDCTVKTKQPAYAGCLKGSLQCVFSFEYDAPAVT